MDDAPEDAILDRPLDIYRPFSTAEVDLLRVFVSNVRELQTYSFFEQVPSQMSLNGTGKGAVRAEMREPSREATRAAAALFRQVYWHREPANFSKVMECLKRSVHERASQHRDLALQVLNSVLAGQKVLLDHGAGIAMYHNGNDERRRLTTQRVLAIYLNGVWLHGGNDHSRRAAVLDNAPPFARFTFYSAIYTLTRLYITAAAIVERALVEPGLGTQALTA